ncbi:M17 family peptidase N-terminal domain-containing protein, partial [uncultured Rhodococcus sp.]|uniref:M17 family peptidase N-terminal domain-containing protein n=1 Tax=uncultured Rhodococcus sp. TaxID=194249 RepID=UPI0028DB222F
MSTRTARSLGPDLVLAGTVAKRAEILVVGLTSGPDGPEIALSEGIVAEDVLAEILDSLIAVGATGKPEQLNRVPAPSELSVTSVLAVGLGSADKLGSEQIRKSAGAAARSLSGIDTVATTLSILDLGAAAEGFALGAYSFTEFKSSMTAPGPDSQPLARVELLVPSPRTKETKA